jgi:large subunit ribosomal protein L17
MHRHQYRGRKFSREAGPRKAMLRNLASQVILHEKIVTTVEKAKELRPIVEKLITKAKTDTVAARRDVAKFLIAKDQSLEKLFIDLGPLYKERNGGYTRIIKIGTRKGDNAEMAQIELLDTDKLTKKEIEKDTKKKAVKKVAAPKVAEKAKKAPAKPSVKKPAAAKKETK